MDDRYKARRFFSWLAFLGAILIALGALSIIGVGLGIALGSTLLLAGASGASISSINPQELDEKHVGIRWAQQGLKKAARIMTGITCAWFLGAVTLITLGACSVISLPLGLIMGIGMWAVSALAAKPCEEAWAAVEQMEGRIESESSTKNIFEYNSYGRSSFMNLGEKRAEGMGEPQIRVEELNEEPPKQFVPAGYLTYDPQPPTEQQQRNPQTLGGN